MLHFHHVQNWTDWLGLYVAIGSVVTIVIGIAVAATREHRKANQRALKAAARLLPRHALPTFLVTGRFLGQYGLFDLWVGIEPEGTYGEPEVVAVAIGLISCDEAKALIVTREDVLLLDDGAHALDERAIREAGRRAGWILPSPVPAYIEEG